MSELVHEPEENPVDELESDEEIDGDCTPSFDGGYWTDPNDPTA